MYLPPFGFRIWGVLGQARPHLKPKRRGSPAAMQNAQPQRDLQEQTLYITPSRTELTDRFGNHYQIGLLGIARPALRKSSFLKAVCAGLWKVETLGRAAASRRPEENKDNHYWTRLRPIQAKAARPALKYNIITVKAPKAKSARSSSLLVLG
jgi:hypothetical protein